MTVATKRTYDEIIEKADAYKEVGQIDHYLGYDGVIPEELWAMVTDISEGGSHRLEICTSLWVVAAHPSGLRFKWSVEVEDRDANGWGYYKINEDALLRLAVRAKDKAGVQLLDYLTRAADALEANAAKFAGIAITEYGEAAILRRLADTSEEEQGEQRT